MKKDVKYFLAIDEDSSDDEEEKPEKGENPAAGSAEIDIWKELHEMSVTSSQETLSYEAPVHQPNLLVESERFQNTVLPTVIPEKNSGSTDINPENTSKFHEISGKTLESLTDPDDDDGHSLWNYTLSDDMVTIPELGSFKRKKHFNGLVTAQLIEKMLSQSIPRDFPFNDSIQRT